MARMNEEQHKEQLRKNLKTKKCSINYFLTLSQKKFKKCFSKQYLDGYKTK